MNRYPRAQSLACASLLLAGCASSLGQNKAREANHAVPDDFGATERSTAANAAQRHWSEYFADPHLKALIRIALKNNQELNIRLQEMIIAGAEVGAARGEYLPRVDAAAGVGVDKVGEHTSQGVSDEANGLPAHLGEFSVGLQASWEVDVWGRLRNAKAAADHRYLASGEAKNFVVTELIAELANSYWELVALDKNLETLKSNIEIQQAALEIVVAKKLAARATQLEVQRFQAEVLKNQAHVYELEQERVVVENRINFLVGRFPQHVERSDATFMSDLPETVHGGVPTELLENRPDVRAAAAQLEAAKLDTKSAKARFYPSLSIEAGIGYEAFNAKHLVSTPASLAYGAMGGLVAPLLNRSAIEAEYRAANARQVQAVYNYERALVVAVVEVVNALGVMKNLTERYKRMEKHVELLGESIELASTLYRSAHADYMEVLLTRRESLEAQMELIETRKEQRMAVANIYRALGGGWRKDKE